jgi:hypothetical protein
VGAGAANPGDVAAMTASSDKVLAKAVAESAEDPAYFCRFFLRDWFPGPIPPVHLGLLALFTRKVAFLDKYPDAHEFLMTHFTYMADPDDPESVPLPVFQYDADGLIVMVAGPNNAVVMPRGFSKTTLYNAGNLYELVTDKTTFSVYVSESSDHAERQLGNIKRQLEDNKLLRRAYGNVVPKRADSEKWGADEIQLNTGAILLARGRGSQVRGLNFNARRPNRIVLDDVEDKESVATAQQRKKVSDWFYGDVVPAGNEMADVAEFDPDFQAQQDLQITVLGTLLHAEALLVTLQKDPTFNHISFGAKLPDGSMLWPQKMSHASYEAKKERFRRTGKLAEFSREFDSSIRIEEDAMFQPLTPQFYVPIALGDLIQRAQACDPAISEDPNADHATIVVGGRKDNGMLWVLAEWGGTGMKPHEIVEQLFKWHKDFQLHITGIEAQAYQKSLVYSLRELMAKKQQFFTVKPITQGNNKTKQQRIEGILQPRYYNGYVRHAKYLPKLEAQLQDFPNGKYDYADATAMMFSLLGETQFLAADPETIGQDQYPPLPDALTALYKPSDVYAFPDEFAAQQPFAGDRYG